MVNMILTSFLSFDVVAVVVVAVVWWLVMLGFHSVSILHE